MRLAMERIALTDCSSIVMAHELGYFKKFGINSIVSKEASWAVIRDKLMLREFYTVPFARPRKRAEVLDHPDYYSCRSYLIDFLENHARQFAHAGS